MNPAFDVRYAGSAREDLLRRFDFLLDRATTVEDFDSAQLAINVVRDGGARKLSRSPFFYREAGNSPFLHELLIPLRGGGYVAHCEITDARHATVLAVRHQLDDDCH